MSFGAHLNGDSDHSIPQHEHPNILYSFFPLFSQIIILFFLIFRPNERRENITSIR